MPIPLMQLASPGNVNIGKIPNRPPRWKEVIMPRCFVAQIWLDRIQDGKVRQKRFVRKRPSRNKKRNDGNLSVDPRVSLVMSARRKHRRAPASEHRETAASRLAPRGLALVPAWRARLHLCSFDRSRGVRGCSRAAHSKDFASLAFACKCHRRTAKAWS
jgi:hypothetical protein